MAEGTAGGVSVSGGMGIVVGTGNTQINNLPSSPPLTPATFAALSPDAAARRVRQMSHDEAVDLFANASVEDLMPKMSALLLRDEAMAFAILGDLDPYKAEDLLSPFSEYDPPLAQLPAAAAKLASTAAALKWDHGDRQGRLERAPRSRQKTEGYFRQYEEGRLYWSIDGDDLSYPVCGAIAAFHLAKGGTGGELGFPLSEEEAHGREEVEGSSQEFEGGFIVTSLHGTYRVSANMGRTHHWPGLPVAAARTQGDVESQLFEDGFVCSSEARAISR
jgi:hypothetical protein